MGLQKVKNKKSRVSPAKIINPAIYYITGGIERMVLFDVSRYETPNPKDVNLAETKHNVSVFLAAYLSSRCRVGQPREPKVTQSFSLIPPSTSNTTFEAEQILMDSEDAKEEFVYLHKLFIKGYSVIQHPFKPDITERRKKVFYDRYISGLPIYVTAQRNNISEELVSQESAVCIVQFASALELTSFK